MSQKRQPYIPPAPDGSVWVRSFAVRFTEGYEAPPHRHDWHQLSYASEGALRVATAEGAWVAPPHRAIWIPAGVDHREDMRSAAAMRSLYFASTICGALPTRCAVLNVPPLLRELILETAGHSVLDSAKPEQRRFAQVLVDRLALLEPAASQVLPMPRDRRALAIARRLQNHPANKEHLGMLARRAGASLRTAQRLFVSETGMAFAQWRQRLRLLAAIERLGAGRSVTDVAFDVG
ncbi:MAG: helix-turn-helix domain-containing protein, partial [Vitreimonas sp.]